MGPKGVAFAVCACLVCARFTGAAESPEASSGSPWRASQVETVDGLRVPESVLVDAAGVVYISNVDAAEEEYWTDDGKGFISRMTPDGRIEDLRWLEGSPGVPINAPKGMCILKGYLFFTDNGRFLRYPLDGSGFLVEVPLPYTKRLNDAAADGGFAYVSDIELGIVYKVGVKGGQTIVEAPKSVNGLTFHKGRMFAVSWDLHEVFELDPEGDKPPEPFGVAEHFTSLDGIEVLDDGTFIVSDFTGNKVCVIAPDRTTVHTLIEIESPADIGLDRQRGLLYVPQFMQDKVVVFKLEET